MRRLILSILLVALLLLALLASCKQTAPAQVGQTTTPSAVTSTTSTATTQPITLPTASPTTTATGPNLVKNSVGQMVEKPLYGGVINDVWNYASLPGVIPYGYVDSYGCLPAYDALVVADITKGPTGTKETPLTSTYAPISMLVGNVITSWEQPDLQTLVFHLRQDVHFQNKPPANGRVADANDLVWSINRYQSWPNSEFYKPPSTPANQMVQAKALDKWTVQVTLPAADPFAITSWGRDIVLIPHEIDEVPGGASDWHNECGTGPFMITDWVTGSSVTFSRNPNYWRKDPFFPDNTLPYVDQLRIQLVQDPATQLAALRTGKIDQLTTVSLDNSLNLFKTNPQLKYQIVPPTGSRCVYLNCGTTPFNDIRVRQAVFLATDFKTIADTMYHGKADIITWPVLSNITDIYTPPDKLPTTINPLVKGSETSASELFSYNPQKAKQLMAEAGYPNGLKISMYSGPSNEYTETIPVILNYWGAIGFQIDVQVMEESVLWGHTMTVTYPNAARCGWGNANPSWAFAYGMKTGHPWNSCGVVDPYLDAQWVKITSTVDVTQRTQMWKDLNLYAIEQAYYYTFPAPNTYNFWQPWIKQHAGESLVARFAENDAWAMYAWIDQSARQSTK